MWSVRIRRIFRQTPTSVERTWEEWEVWVEAVDAGAALAKVLRRKRFVEFLQEGGEYTFKVYAA